MRFDRIRHVFCGSIIAAAFFAAAPAMGQTPYDGLWNVTIVTKTGSCEPSAHYPLTVADGKVSVVAPFVEWSKADIVAYSTTHCLPTQITYSCEAGECPPCGSCPSCRDRRSLGC